MADERIPIDALERTYSARPVVHETARSELFRCDYSISARGIVFHIYSDTLQPAKILAAAKTAFDDIIPDKTRIYYDIVSEPQFGIEPNVFIRISDQKDDTSVTRGIIRRGLTALYEKLRGG